MNNKFKELIAILDEIKKKNANPEIKRVLEDVIPILEKIESNSPNADDNHLAGRAISVISLIPGIMSDSSSKLANFLRNLNVTHIELSELSGYTKERFFGTDHKPMLTRNKRP